MAIERGKGHFESVIHKYVYTHMFEFEGETEIYHGGDLGERRTHAGQVLDISTSIIDDTTISISFDPPEFDGGVPITEYKIDYDTLPTFTYFKGLPVGTKTSASNNNILLDNLTPGKDYYIRVAASNAQGQGPYSYFNNVTISSWEFLGWSWHWHCHCHCHWHRDLHRRKYWSTSTHLPIPCYTF